MLIPIHDLGTAYFALEWLIRLAALFVVPLNRKPTAAAAWLLLIFFLPAPGSLLYLAIGRPRFPSWRTRRFRELLPYFEGVTAKLNSVSRAELGQLSSVASLTRRLGNLPAAGGNTVELIDDYDQVIKRLVEDIDLAQRQVRLLVYIFADDYVGKMVIAALGRAAKRGVVCQVMVDSIGSRRWIRGTIRLLREAGVDARRTLPFNWFRNRSRRDMRNHRKLFVIDGMIGYAGSQNIVAKDFRPGVVNRELVARVTGPIVAAMEAVVLGDWFLESEAMPRSLPAIPAPTGDAVAQLLPSGAHYALEGLETLLVWQLHQARERAVIVTPYFVPDEDVLGAMRTAVARGVEINVVVSKVVDQPLVSLAQCSYYEDLLTSGIRIHLFRDYLLHAKNVSIDGRLAIVGSSNVDLRSFQLNEEVSLLLYDPSSVARLAEIQCGYLDGSEIVELETWRKRPRIRALAENIARLISPLL